MLIPLPSDSQLKRVVVLSSIAAICPVIPTHAETFNEDNWNEADIKHVQEHGEGATPFAKYCSAKALAEKGVLLVLTVFFGLLT